MQGRADARAMRQAAAELRWKADRVAAVARELDSRVRAMIYTGPAATRFRQSVTNEQARLREVVRLLSEAADALQRSAASVEADPSGFYGGSGS